MFLLLDFEDGAIFKGPFDDVRVRRRALDPFALFQGRVEVAEVLEFDEVPDRAEWRLNDGGFED